jgi:hypothetical protein
VRSPIQSKIVRVLEHGILPSVLISILKFKFVYIALPSTDVRENGFMVYSDPEFGMQYSG